MNQSRSFVSHVLNVLFDSLDNLQTPLGMWVGQAPLTDHLLEPLYATNTHRVPRQIIRSPGHKGKNGFNEFAFWNICGTTRTGCYMPTIDSLLRRFPIVVFL